MMQKAPHGAGLSGGARASSKAHAATASRAAQHRRPPYDRLARERLADTNRARVPAFGTLFIHAGQGAWEAAKADPRAAVALPPAEWPEGFDWSLSRLATPPTLLLDHGASDEVLTRTARALIRDGARRVLILPRRAPMVLFQAKEVAHGAA